MKHSEKNITLGSDCALMLGRGRKLVKMSDEKDELKAHGEDVHIGEIYSEESEKTVFKALGLGGCLSGGAPCVVDVKNGKIVRFGPLQSLGLSLSQAS